MTTLDALLLVAAVALALGAALGFYRAQGSRVDISPSRRRTARLPHRRPVLAGGAVLALLLSLVLLGRTTGPVAGPCFGVALLMLGAVALPYLSAWRRLLDGAGR